MTSWLDAAARGLMLSLCAALCFVLLAAFEPQESETGDEPASPTVTETAAPSEPVRDRDGIIWSTKIDWAALYPEPERDGQTEQQERPTGFAAVASRLSAWIDDLRAALAPLEEAVDAWEETVDDTTNEKLPFYGTVVELANAYDALIGWEIVAVDSYNAVINAGDNYFLTCVELRDETANAQAGIEIDALCRELGMKHLYIETPGKTCRDDAHNDVTDFYNRNADSLLGLLSAAGVETLDLRDALHEAGMDHHASFYQTDHHWLAETGLWATGVIAETVNERFGLTLDTAALEAEKFDYVVYEDWFLGSQGKKVTLARAVPEDFTMIYPKETVDLSISIPSLAVEKRGDFDVTYRYAMVDTCDYYNLNPYAAYLYGDNALTRITNHNAKNDVRVLMLGHSFDNTVVPFLALAAAQVDSIDLRTFTGSLETFLRENQYDVVIECYTI